MKTLFDAPLSRVVLSISMSAPCSVQDPFSNPRSHAETTDGFLCISSCSCWRDDLITFSRGTVRGERSQGSHAYQLTLLSMASRLLFLRPM